MHSKMIHFVALASLLLAATSVSGQVPGLQNADAWNAAVREGARQHPAARIIVLDVSTGSILATQRFQDASRTLAEPGSTLKPLMLYQVLSRREWDSAARVQCNRRLTIARRSLQCSHPAAAAFDARNALAWSCNSYFAAVARALPPGTLEAMLRHTGLLSATGLYRNEAIARFTAPRSLEDTELRALGVDGIEVTPLELALAYRWLAGEIAKSPQSRAAETVLGGLEDSASFGMAAAAQNAHVQVAGKTGTAGDAAGREHGWFSGFAPADHPRVVLVVYMPAGRGSDAARVAGEVLAHSPLRGTGASE